MPRKAKPSHDGDMCSPDMLKNHMWQVGDLGSFPSLSPKEKKNEALAKLQRGVIFVVEAI
ncbi:unnamed protein product [Prunus armeniaca]